MAKDAIFVGITDFTGQRFVVSVAVRAEATAASVAYDRTPLEALKMVYRQIKGGEPIDCEIVHQNNRAKQTVIFDGPCRINIDRELQ